jgi:hypothetical protein
MKSIIISIFSLSILLGCTNSAATKNDKTGNPQVATGDSTEKVALQHLFERVSKLPQASLKGNEIIIGDTSIRLKIGVEFDGQNEDKWIYAANISTSYKAGKETRLDFGSIGIGSNKDEAMNVCVQEWFASFGIPFTNMINGDENIKVSNIKVFAGLMGIRGNLPEKTWLKGDDEMTTRIISQIQSQIQNTDGDIIPVDIKLMIGKNGVSGGECRIANKVSEQLLQDLKHLNWPSSENEFMFKQFYLVDKTSQFKRQASSVTNNIQQ